MNYSNASLKTDKLIKAERIDSHFIGDVERLCEHVKKNQIYIDTLWARFVKQFSFPSDVGDNGWRCEFWGKMMRGAASVYAYTHDEELYNVLKGAVEGILATSDENGRITSYMDGRELRGWDMWGRKYVLLGLQYFCEVCPDATLVERCEREMCRQLDCIIKNVGREEGKMTIGETSQIWVGVNSCSILEPVVRLYNRTGKKEYLDFASHIVDTCYGKEGELKIFKEALEDKLDPHEYSVNKAYEMMSCFEGLIEYYRTVGGEEHLTACKNFARRVFDSEISIIGCSGCTHELFDNTGLRQVDPEATGIMQETCVTVTWMKLCGQMLRLTGDVRYADAIEQSFFNAFLGSANFQNRNMYVRSGFEQAPGVKNDIYGILPFDSYSPLRSGARGQFIGGFKMFTDATFYGCCACISPMGIGTYTETAALLSADGIVQNSYLAGDITLDTCAGKVTLKTASGYPYDGNAEIEIDGEGEFAITLRIPEWSRETALSVNGEAFEVKNGYNTIKRAWKKGDKINLSLDDNTYVVLPPIDSPYKDKYIALKKGAIVLALDKRVDDPDMKIDLAYDENGKVEVNTAPCEALPYYNLSLKVKQKDGSERHFVDYASAGSTFDKDSTMAAWVER